MEQNFARQDGEPFDPTFYLRGEPIAEGLWRVEDDLFIDRVVEELVPSVEVTWRARAYRVPVPALAAAPGLPDSRGNSRSAGRRPGARAAPEARTARPAPARQGVQRNCPGRTLGLSYFLMLRAIVALSLAVPLAAQQRRPGLPGGCGERGGRHRHVAPAVRERDWPWSASSRSARCRRTTTAPQPRDRARRQELLRHHRPRHSVRLPLEARCRGRATSAGPRPSSFPPRSP